MLIGAIAGIFFFSWLPLNVFSLVMEMYPEATRALIEGDEALIFAALHLCGIANACMNPILYGYLNENFRKEYRNIYR